MDTTQIILIVAGVVGVTFLLARNREEQIKQKYQRFEKTRKFIWAVGALLIAWTLLNSGDIILVLIAVGLLVFVSMYIFVERPHDQVV
jgi:asparagine N-glycosylation enzyme membrane subunit Stt3